jgi:hypothetical protein
MEKVLYHYIGSESQIGDLKLEKFGTEVSLTPAEALNAIEGGAQLCPHGAFTFTEQEVSLYPYPAFRASAPEAFHVKHRAALVAVAEHLAELRIQQNQATEGR